MKLVGACYFLIPVLVAGCLPRAGSEGSSGEDRSAVNVRQAETAGSTTSDLPMMDGAPNEPQSGAAEMTAPTTGEVAAMAGEVQSMIGGVESVVSEPMTSGDSSSSLGGRPNTDEMINSCTRDFDCPVGQECINGRCIPDEPAPQAGMNFASDCARDFDCPVGLGCENGQCVRNPNASVGGMMTPMGDMGGGIMCVQNADCPGDLFCVNEVCATCRLDSDCGLNQRCNDGGACTDSPPECANDNECRADGDQVCQAGRCIEAQCFGNQQCRGGSRCVAGACQVGAPGDGGGTCNAPTPLAIGEVARGRPQNTQQFGSCSINEDFSGPESVYLLNATFTGDVCLTTAWHTWTGFNAEIYVRQGMCADGMEAGCDEGGAAQYGGLSPDGESNQGALTVSVEEGQSYFVFVDARLDNVDDSDTYVLSAIRGACDGASLPTACDEPQHMELGAVFEGNSRRGSYAHVGTCTDGDSDGAEQVVHFRSGPEAGSICVRIDGDNVGDTDSIYVRKTNCADGAEVGCSAERRAAERTVTVDAEPDTDYFVFVDSSLRGSPYTLSVIEGACP